MKTKPLVGREVWLHSFHQGFPQLKLSRVIPEHDDSASEVTAIGLIFHQFRPLDASQNHNFCKSRKIGQVCNASEGRTAIVCHT